MISNLLAGRYKVLQVLGAGGFGKTYIVEDIHLPGNPKCVLKQLKPASDAPPVLETAKRLFEKEAETLQKLGSHDQIPRLLAYFEQNKDFYLVQELIDGHTLSRELLPGQRWTESQITEMLIESLSILGFVHSQGVIHRDIKPDNIIRRIADNKLVLIDFGAIKQVRNQSVMPGSQASISVAIGTPGYMPTEQSRGTPRPSSDIYALGMIGIQALTGVYPHELQEDPDTGEILWQHLVAASPELCDILHKMTRYHFKDRYQTADEALSAVKQLVNPVSTPTVQANSANTSRHELTLEWMEIGQVKTQTITENQQSKNPGTVRIGRDPAQCDIVLSAPTVSALHVEIFFSSQQQSFYLRSLRESNPPIVNGQSFRTGEVMLDQGSNIRLGQLDLQVKTVAVQHYPAGYTPTEYAIPFQSTPPQPIAQTVQVPKILNSQENTIPVAPANPLASPLPASVSPSPKELPHFIRLGMVAILSAGGIFALVSVRNAFNSASSSNGSSSPSYTRSNNLGVIEQCRLITPGGGRITAKLRNSAYREAREIATLASGTQVSAIEQSAEFVNIQTPDGTTGWVFNSEISNCPS